MPRLRRTLFSLPGALLTLCTLSLLALPALYFLKRKPPPDAPDWKPTKGSRRAVKERTASDGQGYLNFNNGRPISLTELFALLAKLDAQVPRKISNTQPIPGVETIRVTVRAYLMSARFKRSGDRDIHAELGAVPRWNAAQFITEIPPGPPFQPARRAVWDLVRRDIAHSEGALLANVAGIDKWVFRRPPLVVVSGFIFLDAAHAKKRRRDYSNYNARRGYRLNGGDSRVRGLWEIHPVLTLWPLRDLTVASVPMREAPIRDAPLEDVPLDVLQQDTLKQNKLRHERDAPNFDQD